MPKPDVRPLVVAMPGGVSGRVVVAAFTDAISGFGVAPKRGIGQSAQAGRTLTFSDGGQACTVRFKLTAGDTLRQAIPAGDRSFVLNGDAQDPKKLPDP